MTAFGFTRSILKAAGALAAGLLATAALSVAGTASAGTYTYVGANYIGALNHLAPNCAAVGGCLDFNTAQNITGSFTIAGTLSPNLAYPTVVVPQSYSFSDGVETFASTDPGARRLRLRVGTDASGAIVQWTVYFEAWRDGQAAGHGAIAANATTSTGRLNAIQIENHGATIADNVVSNGYCLTYPSNPANNPANTPDSCDPGADAFTSQAASVVAGVWTSPPAPVPTLSEWAVILFGMALTGAGLLMSQQRRLGFLRRR